MNEYKCINDEVFGVSRGELSAEFLVYFYFDFQLIVSCFHSFSLLSWCGFQNKSPDRLLSSSWARHTQFGILAEKTTCLCSHSVRWSARHIPVIFQQAGNGHSKLICHSGQLDCSRKCLHFVYCKAQLGSDSTRPDLRDFNVLLTSVWTRAHSRLLFLVVESCKVQTPIAALS